MMDPYSMCIFVACVAILDIWATIRSQEYYRESRQTHSSEHLSRR